MKKNFMNDIVGEICKLNDKIKITKDNDFAAAII